MTRYKQIKNMSEEELALFLAHIINETPSFQSEVYQAGCDICTKRATCKEAEEVLCDINIERDLIIWLNSEAKEESNGND